MLKRLIILALVAILCILAYIFTGLGKYPDFAIHNRSLAIGAIIAVGVSIGVSTVIFQTITQNKILTPSIIGLDSLYTMLQAFLVFALGSAHISTYNENVNFLISTLSMVVFTLIFYKILFKEGRNIYLILLLGLIFGTFFSSLSLFFEVLIDPDEFLVVQGRMFASFNNIQSQILLLAYILIALSFVFIFRYFKYLDPLSLDKDLCISLGVPYHQLVSRLMIIVAVLVSVSTALVGPITFLGLLVANISYEFFRTYKHSILLLGCSFISIITLVGGMLIVSRVFAFDTTVSVVINFLGGIYFIYLVLKGGKL